MAQSSVPATAKRLYLPFPQNLLTRIDRSGGLDACWPWMGGCSKGYGHCKGPERVEYAHRLAWKIANGEIPDGMDILHSCDNPPCCNPRHLSPGTHQDNMDDMFRKGREGLRYKGSQNSSAKLTEENVVEIYVLISSRWERSRIAKKFGISKYQIYSILIGRTWRHVQPPSGFAHPLRDRFR